MIASPMSRLGDSPGSESLTAKQPGLSPKRLSCVPFAELDDLNGEIMQMLQEVHS